MKKTFALFLLLMMGMGAKAACEPKDTTKTDTKRTEGSCVSL